MRDIVIVLALAGLVACAAPGRAEDQTLAESAIERVAPSAGPSVRGGVAPSLQWPIDCSLGEDCWLVAFLDHAPGDEARDFACGAQTRDDLKGFDVAIADRARMRAGVAVLAAADGVVIGARDGMADRPIGDKNDPAIVGRECGNGVVIDHGGSWESQYCHMRRGSIAVAEGDTVAAGDLLGMVGLSGFTNFPHLYMTLRHEGDVVDPFTGARRGGACVEASDGGLWAGSAFDGYRPARFALAAVGVAQEPVDNARLDDGAYRDATLARDDVLVVWAAGFGLRPGDVLRFSVFDASGSLAFAGEHVADRRQASFMRFHGRRRGLPAGRYLGEVEARDAAGRPLGARAVAFALR